MHNPTGDCLNTQSAKRNDPLHGQQGFLPTRGELAPAQPVIPKCRALLSNEAACDFVRSGQGRSNDQYFFSGTFGLEPLLAKQDSIVVGGGCDSDDAHMQSLRIRSRDTIGCEYRLPTGRIGPDLRRGVALVGRDRKKLEWYMACVPLSEDADAPDQAATSALVRMARGRCAAPHRPGSVRSWPRRSRAR